MKFIIRTLIITIILSLFASFPAFAEESDFVSVEVAERIRQELQLQDFSLWPIALPKGVPDRFTAVVEFEGVLQILHLERYSVRTSVFRSRMQQADGRIVEIAAPPIRTYRGFIEGRPDSFVAASLLTRGLTVSIIEPDKSIWHIEPMPKWGMSGEEQIHVIYRQEDVIPGDGICGSDLLTHPDEDDGLIAGDMASEGMLQAGNCIKVCEIAFDADLEFYQKNGSSVSNTIADIESIVNSMDLIYARDTLIRYAVTDTLVRTAEPDPYSSTGSGDLLDEFRSEWNSNQTHITRDTAHLMTGKDLDGNVIGVAWVTVICNKSWAYGLSQSRYTSNFSHRVALTAHEVGHNWSAGHCNADSDCSIMCSGLGGCSGNVSGFGSSAIEQIMSYRSSRTCLQDGAGLSTPVSPKVNLDKIVLLKNEEAVVDVLVNDYDGNCDTPVIDDFQTVSNLGGTVVRSVGTGPEGRDELVYTPPSYDFGEDSFTYTVGDGTGMQATGTVKVNVRLPNTMQGYWKLDETSGSTAGDASGSGFNGTLEGTFTFDTASVSGKFGSALSFNGVDDHIENGKTAFSLGLIGNAARTVTAWVYTRSFNDGGIYEMGRHSPGQDFSLRTMTVDNQWRVQYWGSDPTTGDIDFTYTSKNRWVHFAHVHDGTTTKIYADGQLVVNQTRTLNTAEDKTFKIGLWDDHYFDGLIDDVRIYNYALDLSEIYEVIAGGWADNPRPFDTEDNVPQRALLTWVPGAANIDHDVYFGTSQDAVSNATTASAEYRGRQGDAFYVPYMDRDTEYFWRIDEVPNVPPPPPPPPPPPMSGEGVVESEQTVEEVSAASVITGNVWSFRTGRNMGTITREVWTGIGGNYISDLTSNPSYPDSPVIREEITRLEGPTNWADNYGTRIHGFLTPSVTGNYTYWIASDDQSELWLSSDSNPANEIRRAYVPGWTDPRRWYDFPEQQSSPILLTAGQPYYIKVLHKEGGGDDNLAVAWEGPNTPQQVISKLYLSPYDIDFPTPDPMSWAIPPHPVSSTSVSMTATAALDRSGVEYYFACTLGGGHDSGWQDSPTYVDTGLEPNTVYRYIVTARDENPNHNTTASSQPALVRTALLGDFEPDGDVDFCDYSRFAFQWPGGGAESAGEADLDGDNDIDRQDLAILLGNWLETAEQPPPVPSQASNPNPSNGATSIEVTANLSWTAGTGATSHDVYFGTSNPPAFRRNQAATTYDPPGLMPYLTRHYWRIDEVNSSGKTPGIVWSFTTGPIPPPP